MKKDASKDRELQELRRDVDEFRRKYEEAEANLRAIREGGIDALVIPGPRGEQVYTLTGAERSYRILVETMNEGAVIMLADGTILYANRRFAEMLGQPLSKVMGTSIDNFVAPRHRELVRALLSPRAVGQTGAKAEVHMRRRKSEEFPALLSANQIPIDDTASEISFCMVATDLTQQKNAAALLEAEKLSASILKRTAEAIFVIDESGMVLRASDAATELVGCNPLLKNFYKLVPMTTEDGGQFRISRGEREGVAILASFQRADGSTYRLIARWGRLNQIENHIQGYVVSLADVTDLKNSEESLGVLLRELNHRVKNNLQVIGSLLSLQMRSMESKEARAHFESVRMRIQAMASIHDELHKNAKNLNSVEMSAYLSKLFDSVVKAYCPAGVRVEADFKSECEAPLDVSIATPFALTVNEIVSNSLKHAFTGRDAGRVWLHLRKEPGKLLTVIGDDGVGLNPAIAAAKPTLGLRLVEILSRQMQAQVDLDTRSGTLYQLRLDLPV